MKLPKKLQRFQFSKVVLLSFLVGLMAIGAVPSYLTGRWSWANPPRVTNLKQLKNIRQAGLALPGWQTQQQDTVTIGGHKWSIQELQQDEKTQVTLLLLPQEDRKAQPEVEWMDINGFKEWQTDQEQRLQFKVETQAQTGTQNTTESGTSATRPTSSDVKARFFRGWTRQQTFAVLQWYAWPGGGNPSPSGWFWADQMAQLHRRRLPWVAVSILIPMEPLAEVETALPLAKSLGQTVQAALMKEL